MVHLQGFLFLPAVTTRLELATSGVTGRHSNQLNYVTILSSDAKIILFLLLQKSLMKLLQPHRGYGCNKKIKFGIFVVVNCATVSLYCCH